MPRKRLITFSVVSLVIVLIAGLFGASVYYADLPNNLSQHETLVFGQNRLTPGTQAAVRVLVRDSRDASPLADAEVRVSMQPVEGGASVPLFEGRTDASGNINVSFKTPAEAAPQQNLVVETRSKLGKDRLERAVTLERDYRVLLSTDKPLYQPGQMIHLRLLALSTFDLQAAGGQNVEVTIADGKGNKVFRQSLSTSEYGVAATDFQLASEVNTGPYKITATLGNTSSEKTVNVEHYVLPKFDVNLETERSYYQPGQHVSGSLQADYFFGKPVAGGKVTLEGYTFDVEKAVAFNLEGETDETGAFSFEFDLPGYIAGSELEGGLGRFYVQASVIDQAEHSESADLSLPVAQNALVIEAIPEGGQFRPGVENLLYVLTSYPDGTPAPSSLTINFYNSGEARTVQTGEYGLAEVAYTPNDPYQNFNIQATDTQGQTGSRDFYFEGEWSEETVLLRPERPVYRVGETLNLSVLTTAAQGLVYLDIVREGQTVSTRSLEIRDGHGQAAIDLTPDLYGTLELHAYKVLQSGNITRDTRLVVVDAAQDLQVSLTPGQDTYRPGDAGAINVQVNGADGQGAQAALGLAVVDESVFALAEADPGFARLYFMLEHEILQPRYDLHGYSLPDLIQAPYPGQNDPLGDPALRSAVETTANASLAAAAPRGSFSLQANSHEEAQKQVEQLQSKFFSRMSAVLYPFELLLPVLVLIFLGIAVWREKRIAASLAVFFALLFLAMVSLVLLPSNGWSNDPLSRLGYLVENLAGDDGVLPILLLLGLVSCVVLAVMAWRHKDRLLGGALLLSLGFVVVLGLLIFSILFNSNVPDEAALWGLLAFLLLPLAFVLRASGFAANRQFAPALAALLVGLFLLFGPLLGVMAASESAFFTHTVAQMNGDVFDGGVMMEGELAGAAPPMLMEMPAAAAVPQAAMAEDKAAPGGREAGTQTGSAAEPPRLRQYFPETMLWLPDAVTDENGALVVDTPMADSITTWRITALASTQDGRLGSATAGLRVFQDFFVDLDLPLALTVGDEVSIPVGVFNYLPDGQTVRLEVESQPWFELLDEPSKEISIAANEISVVYFRIKVTGFGKQPFKVTALGERMSDAIQKEVRVFPNGKEIRYSYSDRLTPGQPASQSVEIPEQAIPGTQSLLVKIYPGILSQVVEGLDSILRMPYGCFEQTSSTTYPNVLVMDYLKNTGQASPEVQLKAEEYINLGYQRLTTFEVDGGGFSLFGDAPADRMLTAYGLQEFSDMARVHAVDPAFVDRAAQWLLGQQEGDGTWANDEGLVHEGSLSSLGNDRLPVTAYIVWSLIDAGYGDQAGTQKGLQYVREHQAEAEDPYALALVANALVAADVDAGEPNPATASVLERLAGMAQSDGTGAFWKSGVATFVGSEGQTGSIETTALAALAFLRSDSQADLANAALTYLVRQKDSYGTWYSTQATVLTLKALIQSVRAGGEKSNAEVTITLNGGQTKTLQITPENFDVVQLVSFSDVNPGSQNVVDINVSGEGKLMYQVAGSFYLPWEALPEIKDLPGMEPGELVQIDVAYDRTEMAVNDTVAVSVTVRLLEDGAAAEQALIDLGLPPGFDVQTEDLAALVAYYNDLSQQSAAAAAAGEAAVTQPTGPVIQRFELTGRQVLIYVNNLTSDKPLTFTYHLKARFPLTAQTPASSAYDYYNPEVSGEVPPQVLVVK